VPNRKPSHYVESIETLTEPERRRRRTAQEKVAIVQETLEPGASVSAVARRHGVNANQVFGWRKQYQEGSLAAVKAGETVVPHLSWPPQSRKSRNCNDYSGKRRWKSKS
jgi:transposase